MTLSLYTCDEELEETSDEEERLGLYHRLLHTSQRISEERLAINLLGLLTLTRVIPATLIRLILATAKLTLLTSSNSAVQPAMR